MTGSAYHINLSSPLDLDTNSALSVSNLLYMAYEITTSLFNALTRFASSTNSLDFEHRLPRIIAGFIGMMMRLLHTRDGDLQIINDGRKLIAIGPHRTGWEAFTVISKMKGKPPRFLTTDQFNWIPGVYSFLSMFNVIFIKAASRREDGRSANEDAMNEASKALENGECVAMFPQGNMARTGQEPFRVYDGIAKLAIKHNLPIEVIRLDGFWCLQNPFIPLYLLNSALYLSFLSVFHMNNIRATSCGEIDLHLQEDNRTLPDDEKIRQINAHLYAYYHRSEELLPEDIAKIETEISSKQHLTLWNDKLHRDAEQKKRLNPVKTETWPEEQAVSSMVNA